MIWFALAWLLLLALVIAVPPLLRKNQSTTTGRDLAVYRDQLKELDADIARGLITDAEADAARIEIKRRILALPEASAAAPTSVPSGLAAGALALAVSAISLAIYLAQGRPSLPGQLYNAAAEQSAADQQLVAQVNKMLDTLRAKVAANPNDVASWRVLGTIYTKIGRTKEGIDALARAVTLEPNDANLRAQHGEAIVQDAQGSVTPDAVAAFDEALKRDAKNPIARFYKGLALVQAGKEKEALAAWTALIREAPKDAAWLPAVRAQAQDLAKKLKLDPNTAVP